jgi:phenylacetate-CoA oxygenase PaaI subunit
MTNIEKGYSFHNVSDLDPAISTALLQWGLALADTKYLLGRRLSEWVNGAPTLEAAVGAAAMTQDELGHARSLYSMLSEFPGAPEQLGSETDLQRSDYYSPAGLAAPWSSWADVVATNILFDRALNMVFKAVYGSQFGPLNQRAAKILQEERFHRTYGDSWLARLSKNNQQRREQLDKSLARAWALADAWIGPPDDPTTRPLVKANILTVSPGALREQWLGQVMPLMEKHGFGTNFPQPDWKHWDSERREISNV